MTLFTLENISSSPGNISPGIKLYADQTIYVQSAGIKNVSDLKEFALGLLGVADIIEAGKETIDDLDICKKYKGVK